MRKYSILLLALCAAAVSCISEADLSAPETAETAGAMALQTKITGSTEGEYKEGCLLLYLDAETTAQIENGEMEAVMDKMFEGLEIESFEPALRHAPKNVELARELGLHRWFMVSFDERMAVRSFAEAVAQRPEVSAVQFNATPKLASDCKAIPFRPHAGLMASADQKIPYDDPMNTYQWNLNNTGDKAVAETAREGADVGVMDAWKLTAGTPDVIVAVCDAPVKYTHPDLAANMWTNEAELNGQKGVDDDGNGYIDDIHGYNFYPKGNSHGAINWNVNGESGHGTHVAGIIAAVNGNGIGVSSIAGGSGNGDGVRLMNCQIFEGGQPGGDREMAEAIMYAADNGACIAQCSYGYSAGIFTSDNAYINNAPLEYRAINYFTNPSMCNHPSLESNLVIFAAGNEAASNSDYPGALPSCISVTALGPDYLPAGYTNYGRGCNIAAPGGDYYIGARNEADNRSQILSTCISEVSDDYAWMQGSSMACPHMSGVAALGISYAGKLGKKFTNEEFTSILLTSVNDINQFLAEGGIKPYGDMTFSLKTYHKRMGTGAIDAWKLLMQIEGTPSVTVKAGETCTVDLKQFFGDAAADITYLDVTFDDDAKKTLGLASKPKVKNGALEITCMKNGSAKVKVSAIAGGGQLGGGNNIGGSEIAREISIISRGVYSSNGGWL